MKLLTEKVTSLNVHKQMKEFLDAGKDPALHAPSS